METAKGKTREEIITRLAERIDSFEKYNEPHSHIMAELSRRLARRLGLAQADIEAVAEAALLHDIGLYTMSPAYHSLTGPLNFEQRMDLWRHPIIGEQQMARRDSVRHAQLLVRWHHEWWNGSGYPDRLAFEDIPIGARILRAVELYSALTSNRPYRAAMSENEALETLRSSAGIECDPYIVKAMLALIEDLRAETSAIGSFPEPDSLAPLESSPVAEPVALQPPVEQATQTLFDRPLDAEHLVAQKADETGEIGETYEISEAGETGIKAQPENFSTSESASDAADGKAQPSVDLYPRADSDDRSSEPRAGTPVALRIVRPAPAPVAKPVLPSIEISEARVRSKDRADPEAGLWRGWIRSRYNRKPLLGFEASVLRQIEFRSIAIAFCGWAQLDWYLKSWGKQVHSNDPRAWAAAVSRAVVEAKEPLTESHIARLLEDIYVPGTRLANPHLRRWFGETDAWWMDNLRRNAAALEDETLRAQALMLGIQTGDYALSFDEQTQELRQPLTTVFWRLAGRSISGQSGHPLNSSYNQPIKDFIRNARADLLYLSLPSAHTEQAGAEGRSKWREAWVSGADADGAGDVSRLMSVPQSKQSYLLTVDRLLRGAAHIKTWAIGYQEVGLASARDISDLIKEHRPVRATYSKDLAEVAGGLRGYIIIADQ